VWLVGGKRGYLLDEKHVRAHQQLKKNVEQLLDEERYGIGIEDVWKIEVSVCCAEKLPYHEASIWWDSEIYYAWLHIRCEFVDSVDMIRWLVLHELCELQMWRSGNFMLELLDRLYPANRVGKYPAVARQRETLGRQLIQVRNQDIECRLYGYTGSRRPEHIMVGESEGTK